jgi:glutamyl-tRNA synthetase
MNMLLALGYPPPVYAHLPMILGPDGTKLSKRHGAVSVLQYQDEGFLPEAVLNYLVRLGWSHGDQEYFSVEDMVRLFDIADVNKSASVFDVAKLTWLNQQHMMRAPAASLVPPLRWQLNRGGVSAEDDGQLERIVLAQRERAKTMREMAANSVFFFRAPTSYDEKAVRKHVTPEIPALVAEACGKLGELQSWSAPAIHELINGLAVERGLSLGKLAQPIRLALCGGTVSPPIDATLEILGREESLARLRKAREIWGGSS